MRFGTDTSRSAVKTKGPGWPREFDRAAGVHRAVLKGNGKYMEARDGVALETGLWLFDYMPKIEPESGAFEVHIWEGGLRCSLEELKNAFILFLRYIDAEADSVAAPVLTS